DGSRPRRGAHGGGGARPRHSPGVRRELTPLTLPSPPPGARVRRSLSLSGGRGEGEGGWATSRIFARRRDLHAAESPELHLARREPARLAHVGAGRHVDGDIAAVLRLGVARGEGGGKTQRVPRQPVEAFGIAHRHVPAGASRTVTT